MDEREFNLAREIESALSISSMLNMHERSSTVAYLLQNYKEQIQQEQRKTIAKYRKKIDKLEADLKEANFKLYLIQQGLTTTYLDAAEKEDEFS